MEVETAVEAFGKIETAEDAEASMPLRIETAVEFCPRVAVESMETVDICLERMDVADAEAPMPPRIEMAVEF